jgi:hypothetical protein
MRPPATIPSADWLWLLGSLCRLSRVPFDAGLASQQFPPPHTLLTLREAAHALGFRTGERSVAALDPSALHTRASHCSGRQRMRKQLPRPQTRWLAPAATTAQLSMRWRGELTCTL